MIVNAMHAARVCRQRSTAARTTTTTSVALTPMMSNVKQCQCFIVYRDWRRLRQRRCASRSLIPSSDDWKRRYGAHSRSGPLTSSANDSCLLVDACCSPRSSVSAVYQFEGKNHKAGAILNYVRTAQNKCVPYRRSWKNSSKRSTVAASRDWNSELFADDCCIEQNFRFSLRSKTVKRLGLP